MDGKRLAIRGGSAGGYTTLACLAFRKVFAAGASHYGVSDCEVLAQDTHKFESRYLDGLIGPYPERRDLYIARSPLHHLDGLDRPVIFFQGLEDKIVPPNQAEMTVRRPAKAGRADGATSPSRASSTASARRRTSAGPWRGNCTSSRGSSASRSADPIPPVPIENL